MIEQIKLWFYSLLMMSVVLTGKAPYKKLVTYQYVKDENGGEFHKSGGNSLEADKVADQVGADVVRYLYSSSSPVNDMRFGFNLTDEARRKLLAFWNIYTFFNTYACIDNPDLAHFKPKEENLSISDKWLVESINKFVEDSDKNYTEDKSYLVVKDFEKLVDDISNFYIRSNRKRFWKSENKEDQMTAYWCLYNAIKSLIRVMTPVIPFVTEYIWQNMVREIEKDEVECIMLSGFPKKIYDKDFSKILEETAVARDIMSTAQRLRNEHQIKVKQPLKIMYIAGRDGIVDVANDFGDIIKDELNVKELKVVTDDSMFNDEFLSVNFKKAGAVLKGDVQKLKNALAGLDVEENEKVMAGYKSGKVCVGEFKDLDSDLFNLEKKPKTDFVIAHENGNTVVLDINLDEQLILEGLYREFVRGLQVLRKEADFSIDDRLYAYFETADEQLATMLYNYMDKIKQEVLIKRAVEKIDTPAIERNVEVGNSFIIVKLQRVE